MKREKVKVWWRKIDKDGNVVETGCDNKEYINTGSAINRAEKLFGKSKHWRMSIFNEPSEQGSKFRTQWRIASRDPWIDYYVEYPCDICGTVHKRIEREYGGDKGDSFFMTLQTSKLFANKYRTYSRICPTCAERLATCIDELAISGKE